MAKSINIATEINVLARSLAAAADEKAIMAFSINTLKGWSAQECCLGLGLLASKTSPDTLATVANVASQLTGKLCGPDMQSALLVSNSKHAAFVGKEAWWVVSPAEITNPLLESLTAEQLAEMEVAKELIKAEMAKAPELEMDAAVKEGMLAALADGRWDSFTKGVQENIERVEADVPTVEPKVQTFEAAAAEAVAVATADAATKAAVLTAEEFAMAAATEKNTVAEETMPVPKTEEPKAEKPKAEPKPNKEEDRPFRSEVSGAFRISSRALKSCTWAEVDID